MEYQNCSILVSTRASYSLKLRTHRVWYTAVAPKNCSQFSKGHVEYFLKICMHHSYRYAFICWAKYPSWPLTNFGTKFFGLLYWKVHLEKSNQKWLDTIKCQKCHDRLNVLTSMEGEYPYPARPSTTRVTFWILCSPRQRKPWKVLASGFSQRSQIFIHDLFDLNNSRRASCF